MKNIFTKIGGALITVFIFLATLYGLFLLFDKHEAKKTSKIDTPKKIHEYLDFGRDFDQHRTFLRSPGNILRIKLIKGDHVIYDQTYKSDDGLFRVPVTTNKHATSHVIFAGCSFTWGEGLKDEETLASYIGQKDKDLQGYNLGFPGGGLNTLLHYTSMYHLKDFVKQRSGYMIYSLILPQFDRFFGRYNYISWANPDFVHYAVENNKVVYKGALKDQEFYQDFMKLKSAGLEKTVINTEDPLKWSDTELKKFAIAMNELGKRSKKEFPLGKFIVMIHPQLGSGFNDELRARVVKALESQKLKVWDPTADLNKSMTELKLSKDDFYIKDDGHPTARTNDFLTTWIDQKIKTED